LLSKTHIVTFLNNFSSDRRHELLMAATTAAETAAETQAELSDSRAER